MPRFLLPLFLLLAQYAQAQVDTVPPVLVCKTPLSVHLNPNCLLTLRAQDVLDTVYDNASGVTLGLRKRCTGDGFPDKDHILLGIEGIGFHQAELWAKDSSGNLASCLVNLLVSDYGICESGYSMEFKTTLEQGIDSVYVDVAGSNCLADSFGFQIFSYCPALWYPQLVGYYSQFGPISPTAGYTFSVVPSKDNLPLNGVTTYDLVLISKHLLGIQTLDSPYKIIAADANQDGKVTTFDIVLLRRLILGLSDTLPNGKSWRFLPADYEFPFPQNPFLSGFPEAITVPNTSDPVQNSFYFKGIKIGDVNDSADPGQ